MKKRRGAYISVILLFFLSCTTTPPGQRADKQTSGTSSRPASRIEAPPELSLPAARPLTRRAPALAMELPPLPGDPAARALARMSLDQKVSQRFLSWVPGTVVTKRTRDLLGGTVPGGMLLTAQNVASAQQVREFTTALQRLCREGGPGIPPFIAVEQEGGRVQRLRFPPFTQFPPPFSWGEREDPAFVESLAYVTSREMAAVGCTMNLAPLLDLSGRADESFIGNRSLGWKPDIVGSLGSAFVRGSSRAGVVAVLKHFPGHGVTTQDTHAVLPSVEMDDFLWQRHLRPFRIAVKSGAEAVLVAHIVYKNIDPEYPASLSERIIKGILRGELGFGGIVVSDAINDPSLSRAYPLPRILTQAVRAGVDLIQVSDVYTIPDLQREMLRLLASRQITREDLDRGVSRILAVKARRGLIQ
jgi:beta-N-acetylhexosaminidase